MSMTVFFEARRQFFIVSAERALIRGLKNTEPGSHRVRCQRRILRQSSAVKVPGGPPLHAAAC